MLTVTLLAFAAIAAASGSSGVPLIVVVLLALVGSGGLGYFLDRRSAQASRLANDAVNATTVFQRSLDEERLKRTELEKDLAAARAELAQALSVAQVNSDLIMGLHKRIESLEVDIVRTMQDMNETIYRLVNEEGTGLIRWRENLSVSKLAVVQTDVGLTIVFISDEVTAMLGYPAESLINHSVYEIISSKDHVVFKRAIHGASMAGNMLDVEPVRISMLHADGQQVPMLVAISPHESTITLLLQRTGSI